MNKSKYHMTDIAAFLTAAVLCIVKYKDADFLFEHKDFASAAVLVLTVGFVHLVKAGRLYLVLYGSGLKLAAYTKAYCKATPISIVYPYKLGELYRMYCYGQLLGNGLRGVIIILMDRFIDTTALVTVMLLVWFFYGGRMSPIVYFLLIFLILVFLCYFIFKDVYQYWKKYLIRAEGSEHKLTVLKILEALNQIYLEIEKVVKGRYMILYLISLIAWGIEIGSLSILHGKSKDGSLSRMISTYLVSAVSGRQSRELSEFVLLSVGLLIALYLMIWGMETVNEKRRKNIADEDKSKRNIKDENNCSL